MSKTDYRNRLFQRFEEKLNSPFFYWVIGIAIVLRLLGFLSDGHNLDLDHFEQWATWICRDGIANLYSYKGFNYRCDYPPLYPYILQGLGYFFFHFGINIHDPFFTVCIKLINFIPEILLLWFIWKRSKSKLLLALLLLNPVTIINAYAWGQVDIFFTGALIAAFYFLYAEDLLMTAILLAVAINFKSQTLLFLPLFGFIALLSKVSIKQKVIALGAFFGLYFLINLPFILYPTEPWIFLHPHISASGRFPFISVNAFNIWWGIFADHSLQLKKTFPASVDIFGGLINARTFAFGLFALIYSSILALVYFRKLNFYQLSQLSAFFCLSFFMFLPEMHERYLFPFFFFSAIVCTVSAKEFPYLVIIAFLHCFNLIWAWGAERHLHQLWLFEIGRAFSFIFFFVWIAYTIRSYRFIFKESHNMNEELLSKHGSHQN